MQERTANITPDTKSLISIQDLTNRKCRWPVGDPSDKSFGFCGNPAHGDDNPYCPLHAEAAYRHNYVPRRERQKKQAA